MRPLILLPILALVAGCAGSPTQRAADGLRLLPDIDCKGRVALSGSGQLSAVAGLTNAWNLQGDCGEGFHLFHGRPLPGQE